MADILTRLKIFYENADCHESMRDVRDAIAELERLYEERRWIPITEQPPPVDEKVLYTCFIKGDSPPDYFTEVDAGRWDGATTNRLGNPAMKYDDSAHWMPCSHWMPLPEPPAQ